MSIFLLLVLFSAFVSSIGGTFVGDFNFFGNIYQVYTTPLSSPSPNVTIVDFVGYLGQRVFVKDTYYAFPENNIGFMDPWFSDSGLEHFEKWVVELKNDGSVEARLYNPVYSSKMEMVKVPYSQFSTQASTLFNSSYWTNDKWVGETIVPSINSSAGNYYVIFSQSDETMYLVDVNQVYSVMDYDEFNQAYYLGLNNWNVYYSFHRIDENSRTFLPFNSSSFDSNVPLSFNATASANLKVWEGSTY